MAIVEIRDLIKDYGRLRAVDGITLNIEEGECFGLLGPNGAGKTTVMKMMHCYMPPTSGSIRVFDMDVTKEKSEINNICRGLAMGDPGSIKWDVLWIMVVAVIIAPYSFRLMKRRVIK
jgi:ABC-type multidrug transport system ATPase subunit